MTDQTASIDPPEGLSSPVHPDNGDEVDLPEEDIDDEENVLADDDEVDSLTEDIDTDAPVLDGEGEDFTEGGSIEAPVLMGEEEDDA